MSRLVSARFLFWCDSSMGVLGQVAPPKPLGQEIRVALTSMLLMKRQWFTQRRAFLLSMRWNVGPPLNSLPVRTRGGVCIRGRFHTAKWPNPAGCIEEKPLEEISF